MPGYLPVLYVQYYRIKKIYILKKIATQGRLAVLL